MRITADDIRPGDRIDGLAVALVFPGAPGRYTAVLLEDHTWRHYRPTAQVELDAATS